MINLEKEGSALINWFLKSVIAVLIISVVAALNGCASMPGPSPDLPSAQASVALPNCVIWCHVIVHASKASSDIDSDGQGAVTGATQTLSGESSQTSSKTRNSDAPIP